MSILFSELILFYTLLFRLFFMVNSGVIYWNKYIPKLCESDPLKVAERNGVTIVQVGIKVYDLFNINERDMDFGLQLGFFRIWKDSTVNLSEVRLFLPELAPKRVEECIWKPDVIFRNSKKALLYNMDSPSKSLKVLPGGYFYLFGMYRVEVSCPMEFHLFPMDVQHCPLILSPIATTTSGQLLEWLPSGTAKDPSLWKIPPVTMASVKALQFHIGSVVIHQYSIKGLSGNYSILQANFTFTRRLTSSLVNTYLPSSLVVTLSWVSFWLDPNAVPGRVTLGVTSFLALATQVVHARSALPSLDYMTAIDIWLFACLIFVFSSLVEFTLANKLERKLQAVGKVVLTNVIVSIDSKETDHVLSKKTLWNKEDQTCCHIPGRACQFLKKVRESLRKIRVGDVDHSESPKENAIDFYSRIIFPICGFIFTVVYWIYYL